ASVETCWEMAEYKKAGRARKLVVAGCLVERYRADIRNNMPEVDAVIGTNELEQIVAACTDGEQSLSAAGNAYLYHDLTPRVLATPRHYAYIKIAEGCDHKCAFCIIPRLRGNYRSRPADSIVREARALAARGVKELLLISQDTSFYGVDRGERGALARLL